VTADRYGLAGRRAVVTGAGSGIGRAIAVALARAGVTTLAVGRRPEALAETARVAGDAPIRTHRCDISDAKDVAALREFVSTLWGALDILVCNAAIGHSAAMHEMPHDQLDAIIATNVRGTYLTLQAGIELMLESGGVVVVVGSLGGLRPTARASAYGMSKAATHAMARHAAAEYAQHGIRVNVVAPGATDTALLADADDDVRAAVAAAIPIGRLATAGDIADVTLFLCSDQARHITGQILVVDGGSALGTVT
jgi:NAD(P)-dependent dehydrogenase (short-subunit alcohol dehydrogenase family)